MSHRRGTDAHSVPRITLQSKPPADWELYVTISDALNDHKEAPWYGAWLTVLQTRLFFNFCPSPFVTRPFAQYPLTRDVDIYDAQAVEDDSPDITPSTSPTQPLSHPGSQADTWSPASTTFKSYDQPESMETFHAHRFVRESAPSPEAMRHRNATSQPQTPPHGNPLGAFPLLGAFVYPQTPPRRPATPAPLPASLQSSPPSVRRVVRRSTRLPDFAQLLYKMEVDDRGTVDNPPRYKKRLICLVEVKRRPTKPQIFLFNNVLIQTDEQARYAFAAFPELRRLPVVIALGDFWTYREYSKENMSPSPPWSERMDPSYRETPSRTHVNAVDFEIYGTKDIHRLIGGDGFTQLGTQISDETLSLIRTRVQELNQDM